MSHINAVAYARFSSDRQQESSITVQLADIRKFCDAHGINLIHEYVDEAQTGTNANRKDFQQMVQDVQSRQFQLIIVHRMDRWARNVDDGRYYKKYFARHGVKIVSAIEGFNETPEGEFFELMSMGMAELYSKKLARECAAGKIANAREGKAHGGTPLLGYTVKNKRYVIEESEAKAVRIIFDMILQGYSYEQIRDFLNKNGYRRADGRQYTIHIYDILRNRKYIGEYIYNRSACKNADGKRNHHKSKSDNEIIRIQGGIPRIIDDDTFFKVQQILDGRKSRQSYMRTKLNRLYLLSGLLRCRECESAICGSGAYAHGQRFQVYRCNARVRGIKCRTRDIRTEYMEDYLFALFDRCLFANINAERLCELVKTCYMQANDLLFKKRQEILARIRGIQNKIELLQEEQRQSETKIMQQLLSRQIDELILTMKESEFELQMTNEEIDAFPDFKPTKIRRNAEKYRKRLHKAEFKELQGLYNELIAYIIVDNRTVSVTVNFQCLLDSSFPIRATIIENRDCIALKRKLPERTFIFPNLTVSLA